MAEIAVPGRVWRSLERQHDDVDDVAVDAAVFEAAKREARPGAVSKVPRPRLSQQMY